MEQQPEYAVFPQVKMINQYGTLVPWRQTGMTLRDYFAGQALMGIVARSAWDPRSDAAESAYEYADAMLAARGVKP